MRALIVISPGFPSDEDDTTCLPAQQTFIRAINRNYPDMKVTIISLHYPAHTNAYRWFGNRVYPLHGKRYGKLFRPVLWLVALRLLKRLVREEPQSALLSLWYSETALIGKYAAKFYGVAHRCWLLGQDARKQNKFVSLVRLPARQIVALSFSLAEEFFRHHRVRPQHIVSNALDPAVFASPTEKNLDIVAAGSLIPLKQYHLLLEVAAALKRERPSLSVVLCGDGPERERLSRAAEAAGLPVRFVGAIPHPQVLALMQSARLFVHPSRYEGYSTACLEALYAGCHVVSFTQPDRVAPPHWHVVDDVAGMIARCRTILDEEKDFDPVLAHHIDETAAAMINCFGQHRSSPA